MGCRARLAQTTPLDVAAVLDDLWKRPQFHGLTVNRNTLAWPHLLFTPILIGWVTVVKHLAFPRKEVRPLPSATGPWDALVYLGLWAIPESLTMRFRVQALSHMVSDHLPKGLGAEDHGDPSRNCTSRLRWVLDCCPTIDAGRVTAHSTPGRRQLDFRQLELTWAQPVGLLPWPM